MENRFLEKNARYLKVNELLDYLYLAELPPVLRDCLAALHKEAEGMLEAFDHEFAQKEENLLENVGAHLHNTEELLLDAIRNVSYENIEEVITLAFKRLRKRLDIPQD